MNKRYWYTLNLFFIRSPGKRAEYMKKHGIFHSIGKQVAFNTIKVPLYAKLISIGNNVRIANGVEFLTHDFTHFMLNRRNDGCRYVEKIGCIEIGNNVWIGSGSKILYNVRIGDNVIIGAGTLINRDVPSNSVVAGVPGRVICSFEDYLRRRKAFFVKHPADNVNQEISPDCEREMWDDFHLKHAQEQVAKRE